MKFFDNSSLECFTIGKIFGVSKISNVIKLFRVNYSGVYRVNVPITADRKSRRLLKLKKRF